MTILRLGLGAAMVAVTAIAACGGDDTEDCAPDECYTGSSAGGGEAGSGSSSSSGGPAGCAGGVTNCSGAPNECPSCSIETCACSASNYSNAWFRTSDGQEFVCNGCDSEGSCDCVDAATAALVHCGCGEPV